MTKVTMEIPKRVHVIRVAALDITSREKKSESTTLNANEVL